MYDEEYDDIAYHFTMVDDGNLVVLLRSNTIASDAVFKMRVRYSKYMMYLGHSIYALHPVWFRRMRKHLQSTARERLEVLDIREQNARDMYASSHALTEDGA